MQNVYGSVFVPGTCPPLCSSSPNPPPLFCAESKLAQTVAMVFFVPHHSERGRERDSFLLSFFFSPPPMCQTLLFLRHSLCKQGRDGLDTGTPAARPRCNIPTAAALRGLRLPGSRSPRQLTPSGPQPTPTRTPRSSSWLLRLTSSAVAGAGRRRRRDGAGDDCADCSSVAAAAAVADRNSMN